MGLKEMAGDEHFIRHFLNPQTVSGNFMTKIKPTIFFLLLTNFLLGQDHQYDTTLINNNKTVQIKVSAFNDDSFLLTSTFVTQTFLIDTVKNKFIEIENYSLFPDAIQLNANP